MNATDPLPPPRLILRLGGIGNRKFGEDGAGRIAEDPQAVIGALGRACEAVLRRIEATLKELHQADQACCLPPQASRCPRWITHHLAGCFGFRDRWERDRAGEPGAVFSPDPPEVQVLTGAAEGGDTLIAETARQRNAARERIVTWKALRIVAEAPDTVPADEGLGVGRPTPKDQALGSRLDEGVLLAREDAAKLARIARQRAHAYRAQSEALRHHSDLLLAVWDPDAEGRPGGTSESVALALREQIPVIAVLPRGGDAPEIRVLHSLDDLRTALGDGPPAQARSWADDLDATIKGILRFPDPRFGQEEGRPSAGHAAHAEPAYHPRAAFHRFLRGGHHPAPWPACFWPHFDALARYRAARHRVRGSTDPEQRKASEAQEAEAWGNFKDGFDAFWRGEPGRRKAAGRPAAAAAPPGTHASHYEPARLRASSDGYSGIYGNAHRGGIIASYLFAALAVLCAVVGGILHAHHAPAALQIAVAIIEVVVIGLMFAVSEWSRAEGWNLAYTHARILAEALRLMKHLGPLGIHTPLPRLAQHLRRDAKSPPPEEQWAIWYFRALVRMAPLRLTPEQDAFPELAASLLTGEDERLADGAAGPAAPGLRKLEALRKGVVGKLIDGQIRYHEGNQQKQATLEEDIERTSRAVFLVVFVFAGLHLLAVPFHWEWTAVPCLLVCVGGPAFIAAMHGFLAQIEAARLRQRSVSMASLLKEQRTRLQALDFVRDPAGSDAVWGLCTETLAAAGLMMDEAAGWSMLYTNTQIHAG
ncbi:MAG: hypothetical protein H7A45_02260 [Verrucomicrobiales bacterium]|nr:hypothetical protein [Verrucomicrobiales bacterium]MCP5526513.1 hypothetical protein [Verrucomicrobiales bacterium]